jgi:hypothetical protein
MHVDFIILILILLNDMKFDEYKGKHQTSAMSQMPHHV